MKVTASAPDDNAPIRLLDDPARACNLIACRADIYASARERIAAGDDAYQLSYDAARLGDRLIAQLEAMADFAVEDDTRRKWNGMAFDAEQLALHHLDTLERAIEWDRSAAAPAAETPDNVIPL